MQLFLCGIEAGQDDGDFRPGDTRGPAQVGGHRDAFEWNFEALHGRYDMRSGRQIAAQHALVRLAKLLRIFTEQVLAIVVIDRGANIRLARGDEALLCDRLVAEQFVPMGFLGPDAAPVGPAVDAGDKPLHVVGIDTGRNVSRNEMGKDQVHLRVGRHTSVFLHLYQAYVASAALRAARAGTRPHNRAGRFFC